MQLKNRKKYTFRCERCLSKTSDGCTNCAVLVTKIRKNGCLIRFSCQFCQKRYVNRFALYKHLTVHVENKFVCQECGKIFDSKHKYKAHKSEHLKKRIFKCNLCKARFIYKHQFSLHMKRHGRYCCLKCNQTFASKARILVHKKRGHLVKGLEPKFLCSFCPKLFKCKSSLDRHLRFHEENKFITCIACKKTFSTKDQFERHCHTKSHELKAPESRSLKCDQCEKVFDKQTKLESHMKRIHRTNKLIMHCELCNYATERKANLNRHLLTHSKPVSKQFCCEKCGKLFISMDSLKNHISTTHDKVTSFGCSECEKTFKRSSDLKRHQLKHSDERSFRCPCCDKLYKHKQHLVRHIQIEHRKFVQEPSQLHQQLPISSQGQNQLLCLSEPLSFHDFLGIESTATSLPPSETSMLTLSNSSSLINDLKLLHNNEFDENIENHNSIDDFNLNQFLDYNFDVNDFS